MKLVILKKDRLHYEAAVLFSQIKLRGCKSTELLILPYHLVMLILFTNVKQFIKLLYNKLYVM